MNAPIPLDSKGFPLLPDFGAHWMPVYWEPIIGSGERIALLVAARTTEGEWRLQPAASMEAWACFLGSKAGNVQRLVEFIERSLTAHMQAGKWLQTWRSPLSGVSPGEVRWAHGRHWGDVIRGALADSAFLASLADILPDSKTAVTEHESEDLRWSRLIRDAVQARRPEWATHFNRAVKAGEHVRETRIDYLGRRYCAGFARLVPGGGLARHLKDSKAKLIDLELVRKRAEEADLFAGSAHEIELLAFVPAETDVGYSERMIREAHRAFALLEEFADKHEMRVESCPTHQIAADRILLKDAA